MPPGANTRRRSSPLGPNADRFGSKGDERVRQMEGVGKMTFMERFLQWLAKFGRRKTHSKAERVYLTAYDPHPEALQIGADAEDAGTMAPEAKLDQEIDFSRNDDLEAYTENLNVPREVIEQWISAGLLYPEEIRTAERMLRILRKK